jgi:hypothetical protein
MTVSCGVVCNQVKVCASGSSLVQMSLTECDREASTMKRAWPTKDCLAIKKNAFDIM